MTATITTINPATGAPLQTYPAFSAEQIEQAVAQGHAAALAWGREPLATRVQAVRRLAAELAAECEDKGSRAGHAWNRLHATLAAMAMGLLALEQRGLQQSNL